MSKTSIDELWSRLKACQGEPIETKTGKPFTYDISGDVFHPSRTEYNISRSDFRKALDLVPFEGPGEINNIIRGPAYVWAVLHDKRIRRDSW